MPVRAPWKTRYLKIQYLNKKRGKTVTLRLDNKKAKQLLLEDYSKEEVAMQRFDDM